jgi:hypothetical protein
MRLRHFVLALAVLPGIAAPAIAQSYGDEQRWHAAQERYRAETDLYLRERDRYMASRARYQAPPPPPPPSGYYGDGDGDRFATDYDAARDYRDDPRYAERRLGPDDQVYRGSDGRYYCKRSDGTTGLIVGGAGGAILGNVIDGGHNRAAGTLIGGALGALLGRSIEKNNDDVRCR